MYQTEQRELRPGSKAWWKRSHELLDKKLGTQGVPALKKTDGAWVRTAEEKAELFAATLTGKFVLPAACENEYSRLLHEETGTTALRTEWQTLCEQVKKALKELREDSATGPDLLPTRLLKKCAGELVQAVATLVLRMLLDGKWSDIWREH